MPLGRHIGDVHVGGGHLLLHHLLERGQRQNFCLFQGQIFAVGLLERGLSALGPRANGLGLELDVGAGGIGVEPGDQKW